jgi:hypothetical protein
MKEKENISKNEEGNAAEQEEEKSPYGSPIINPKENPLYSIASFSMKPSKEKEELESDFLLDSTREKTEKCPIVVWKDGWDEFEDCKVWGSYTPKEVSIPHQASGSTLLRGKITHTYIRPELVFFTNKILKLPVVKDNVWLVSDQNFLPPLNKQILTYFSSKDLTRIFRWRKSEDGIEVVLKLPLKLRTKNCPKRFAVISRVYKDEDIVEAETPHMVLWPNFKADDWKHYYLITEKNEKVEYEPYPNNKEKSYPKIRPASLLWKLDESPDAIVCTVEKKDIGLILLNELKTVESGDGKWIVSVDFGTFNTAVFFRKGSEAPKPLPIQNRCLQITITDPQDLRSFLFLHFFPLLEKGIQRGVFCTHYRVFEPVKTKEPLEYSLIPFDDTFGKFEDSFKVLSEAIGDLVVNLKWAMEPQERDLIEIFHKQVLLMICAEARHAGIKKIDLRWSYPTAFPKNIRNEFLRLWGQDGPFQFALKGVGIAMEEEFNIKEETEAVAVCKYATNVLKALPGASQRPQIIIDIGGGTSDVAVWLEGKMLTQTSIRLAGDVITNYLEKNEFRKGLAEIAEIEQQYIDNIAKERPYAAINLLMKWHEKKILMEMPTKAITPHFKGARSRIFFGYSAVLYYIGLLLRNLVPKETKTDCDIFLAGNGARLLKWVSNPEATEIALGNILRSSIRDYFNLNVIKINFSENPKQEVAMGLLYTLEETGIVGRIPENPTILVGDKGYKSLGDLLDWNINLYGQTEKLNPDTLEVPSDFPELKNFVNAYNAESRDINLIEVSISPSEVQASVDQYLRIFAAQQKQEMASVQPLFIEEVKTILEKI